MHVFGQHLCLSKMLCFDWYFSVCPLNYVSRDSALPEAEQIHLSEVQTDSLSKTCSASVAPSLACINNVAVDPLHSMALPCVSYPSTNACP